LANYVDALQLKQKIKQEIFSLQRQNAAAATAAGACTPAVVAAQSPLNNARERRETRLQKSIDSCVKSLKP
jgi:hypothetical protein